MFSYHHTHTVSEYIYTYIVKYLMPTNTYTHILTHVNAFNKHKNNYECLHQQLSAKCTRETAASNAESIVALNRP